MEKFMEPMLNGLQHLVGRAKEQLTFRNLATLFLLVSPFLLTRKPHVQQLNIPDDNFILMANNVCNLSNWGTESVNADQVCTTSELLDMGINGFEFNIFHHANEHFVCNGYCDEKMLSDEGYRHSIVSSGNKFEDKLKEIVNFSNRHPEKLFFVEIGNYLNPNGNKLAELIRLMIPQELIYTNKDLRNNRDSLPSADQLKEQGKRFIVAAQQLKEPNELDAIALNTGRDRSHHSHGTIYFEPTFVKSSADDLPNKNLPRLSKKQILKLTEGDSATNYFRDFIKQGGLDAFDNQDRFINWELLDKLNAKYGNQHHIILGLDNLLAARQLMDSDLKVAKLNVFSYGATIFVVSSLALLAAQYVIRDCVNNRNTDDLTAQTLSAADSTLTALVALSNVNNQLDNLPESDITDESKKTADALLSHLNEAGSRIAKIKKLADDVQNDLKKMKDKHAKEAADQISTDDQEDGTPNPSH